MPAAAKQTPFGQLVRTQRQTMKARRNYEDQLAQAVASWLTAQKPDCLWYHVPNGGWRSKAEAGRFKAMGVAAGVADYAFVLNGGQAAFIELKVGNNRMSVPQKIFADRVQALGGLFAECRSVDDVRTTLKGWGVTWAGQKPQQGR